DTVRHDLLLGKVARRVQDSEILHLLKLMLKASGKRGVPQGGVLSPLLANTYLTEVDAMLERAIRVTREGAYTRVEYARYADDLVILVDWHRRHDWLLRAVHRRLREELAKLDLRLNEEKSRLADLRQGETFGFLGFDFRRVRSLRGVWRAQVNLPRFCRHLRSHESAVGVCHGQTEAAGVHEGVQGAGRSHRAGERESHQRGGAGTRSDGDGAAELGAAGGDRCRPWDAGRAHDRGAGGTRAAAAREPDAADGAGHPKKSNGLLREGESVRFRFIAAEKAVFPVRVLCRTLKVSRAGFYAWQARPSAPRARADERLGLEIAAIHAETRQRYGSPRIHAELGERGCRTGRKRVARLMRVRGLAARRRRRFRVTTQSRHPFPIATNVLARQFERTGPDQAWVTDITYIPTGEGWLYLAVI